MMEAPRRLSANGEFGLPTDSSICADVKVRIDGDSLRDVMAYDCDEGWVCVVKHDDNGKRMRDGRNWLVERIYGKVTAVLV